MKGLVLFSEQRLFSLGGMGFLGLWILGVVGSSICEGLGPFLLVESCCYTGWIVLLPSSSFSVFCGVQVAPTYTISPHQKQPPSINTSRAFSSSKIRRSGMCSRTSGVAWIKASIVCPCHFCAAILESCNISYRLGLCTGCPLPK